MKKKTKTRIRAGLTGLLILMIFFIAGCGSGPEDLPPPLPGETTGPRLQLTLEPGPYYSKDMQIFFYKYTVWPQVAVWLETPGGEYIKTVYVTEIIVTQDFTASPKKGRPEALPVWSALMKESNVDAVSSPTTVGSPVSYGSGMDDSLSAGTYIVKLETNRSYDWNETYTKKISGVNGQPSLIYQAELYIGGERTEAEFEPIGTGSVDGSDGEIRYSLEGIDTALELFGPMQISYEPE